LTEGKPKNTLFKGFSKDLNRILVRAGQSWQISGQSGQISEDFWSKPGQSGPTCGQADQEQALDLLICGQNLVKLILLVQEMLEPDRATATITEL
jgi:hypothetical protein